jgi:hypothetical protein
VALSDILRNGFWRAGRCTVGHHAPATAATADTSGPARALLRAESTAGSAPADAPRGVGFQSHRDDVLEALFTRPVFCRDDHAAIVFQGPGRCPLCSSRDLGRTAKLAPEDAGVTRSQRARELIEAAVAFVRDTGPDAAVGSYARLYWAVDSWCLECGQ